MSLSIKAYYLAHQSEKLIESMHYTPEKVQTKGFGAPFYTKHEALTRAWRNH